MFVCTIAKGDVVCEITVWTITQRIPERPHIRTLNHPEDKNLWLFLLKNISTTHSSEQHEEASSLHIFIKDCYPTGRFVLCTIARSNLQ